MDKRYIRKALQAGELRFFAGAQITFPSGQLVLLEDFRSTINVLLKDQKRITPDQLTSLVSYIQHTPAGIQVCFGMVPSPQGDICKADGEPLDEYAIREIEKRLAMYVKVASNSIDQGNELALTAEESAMYAEDVRNNLSDADDERIAREVAKRAQGTLALFELASGPKEIGGKHNVPTHYPEKQDLTLRSCKVLRWPTRNQAILSLPDLATYTSLSSIATNDRIQVAVSANSREALLLRCADLFGISVDLDINLGEELSPRKIKPQVSKVHDHARVLNETRIRIDAISCPESIETPT